MRVVAYLIALAFGMFMVCQSAEARVRIHVDLASQTMHVASTNGDFVWPVSSARAGFRTPRGTFRVQRMEVMHRSHKYHNSPMPHSIFFAGGYAIHGTYSTGALGRPASHGCIRIAPKNAAILYQLVKQEGAQIAIDGTSPAPTRFYVARPARHGFDFASTARARQGARWAGSWRTVYGQPMMPLGYAPMVPTMHQWIADPAGW